MHAIVYAAPTLADRQSFPCQANYVRRLLNAGEYPPKSNPNTNHEWIHFQAMLSNTDVLDDGQINRQSSVGVLYHGGIANSCRDCDRAGPSLAAGALCLARQ